MREKLWVCDTNLLLTNIEILNKYKVVLLSHVLRELEKHKNSHLSDLAYKARKTVRYIKNNKDKFIFDTKNYNGSELGRDYSSDYEDDNILVACKKNNYGLITSDILLQMKAKGLDIEVIDLENNLVNEEFKGYKFVDLSDEEIAHFYENMKDNMFHLHVNEYLIIRDLNQKTIDKYRWNGNEHVKLVLPPKKFIRPKNDLQECTLDLLLNKDIPIKFIAGETGSGKTFLTTKMGIYHIKEKGNYSKIMMVRNPLGSGEEIGFLQGDKDKKTEGFFKSIIQHLDKGELEAQLMEQRGELIKEIPYYMKGLSIFDTYIIIDEAEDMSPKLIKMLGTRPAENSCIVFSGDWKQAEDKYANDNGLKQAVEYFKDEPLAGTVVLDIDVRSDASRAFANWDI